MAGEYAQNAIIPDGFFKDSPAEETRAFVSDFKGAFDEEPGFIEALSYDTAMILFKLATRPDVLSREHLKDAILDLRNYPGVTGPTSFYSSGDVWKSLNILKIENDRFKSVESQ
ncbi:hypothetical protein EPICR_60048 [Candidatus Desulfarcum epimagneticum]|uniref:Leucine-binding protein domain-containing protein n=1 Tax=uncultured Desulfobacteraceae bacterium TaxID=218296 RepID=A0A484HIE7_9BACT|nr:hypothetical protein EPICR_60048 [uncultured Desulfobacteraceae bacterium]